jgi:methionyl-tRNA formyltransferase
MRITLLGHHDIASFYALNRVIGLLPEHDCVVYLSGEVSDASSGDGPLKDLAAADARLCERFLASEMVGPVAKQLTERPIAALRDPNSPQGIAVLEGQRADLIISIRYRRILRDAAIATPKLGVINLHSGILPDYRGVMATFWAMLQGEPEIGTTLHRIVDAGIDTGPVIEISRRLTRPKSSYLSNVIGLYADGCDAIVRAVHSITGKNTLNGDEQVAAGEYFRAPDSAAVQRFESLGLTLFDGQEDAEITPGESFS